MNKLGEEQNHLGGDNWYDKLTSAANPFKGTTLGEVLEANGKWKELANPFKGTALEGVLEANRKMNDMLQPIRSFSDFMNDSRIEPLRGIAELGRLQSEIREAVIMFQKEERLAFRLAYEPLMGGLKLNSGLVFENLKLFGLIEDESEVMVEDEEEKKSPIIRIDDTIRLQGLIKSIYDDNEAIFKMKPREFEEIVTEMLYEKGFKVELTKQTRDGGRDIIALHDTNGLGINRYLIECKRNRGDRPVGVGVVRELCYSVQKEGANKGIIFTSSYFTRDAVRERELQKYLLDLKNGSDIIDWVREYVHRKNKFSVCSDYVFKKK